MTPKSGAALYAPELLQAFEHAINGIGLEPLEAADLHLRAALVYLERHRENAADDWSGIAIDAPPTQGIDRGDNSIDGAICSIDGARLSIGFASEAPDRARELHEAADPHCTCNDCIEAHARRVDG